MIVYVLQTEEYEPEVCGVFSSEALAEHALKSARVGLADEQWSWDRERCFEQDNVLVLRVVGPGYKGAWMVRPFALDEVAE